MIHHLNQLDESQLQELEQLKNLCKKTDESAPNLYTHLLAQNRMLPSVLLYYEKKQLIGFLSIYFFYENAVEVALLVHPAHRRKGIAKKLMLKILPMLKKHHFSKLIFSCPAHMNDSWLNNLGFSYRHSEYYMERNNLSPLLEYKKPLIYRLATIQDIPSICVLDQECFFKTANELIPRFHQILNDRTYQIILAFEESNLIGKAHLRWQKQSVTFSDIAITPPRQGKGLGTALISYCINYVLSEGRQHLNLDVETHNQKALNLYTRLGFLTQNACDYWEIALPQLEKQMKHK